ncbi:MAG: hypothetical protein KA764_05175 [Anaerolineales bacterium]|nr:hypothetical protein [Anaerolineales bacterium]
MSNSSRSDGDAQVTTLAETDSFMVWTAKDDEGEMTYNLELGTVTVHLFREEWEELVKLIRAAAR